VVISLGTGIGLPLAIARQREKIDRQVSAELQNRRAKLRSFMDALTAAGLQNDYVFAHADLALKCVDVISDRGAMLKRHELASLPQPSQVAADQSYIDAAARLHEGLDALIG